MCYNSNYLAENGVIRSCDAADGPTWVIRWEFKSTADYFPEYSKNKVDLNYRDRLGWVSQENIVCVEVRELRSYLSLTALTAVAPFSFTYFGSSITPAFRWTLLVPQF